MDITNIPDDAFYPPGGSICGRSLGIAACICGECRYRVMSTEQVVKHEPDCSGTHIVFADGKRMCLDDVNNSMAAVDVFKARIRAIHKPYRIFGECDHDHELGDEGVVDAEYIGLTCNYLYDVCSECCVEGDGQTEACATEHEHGKDMPICRTIAALSDRSNIYIANSSSSSVTKYD